MSSSRTETTVEVTMPQMGVSVAEGTITDWVKRPGDWVEADEIVCIVTTDKVDVEIPAPASGRLERVLVEVDQTVPVGTPLAEIDPAAKPGQAHPQEESSEAGEAPEPAPDTATAPERPPAADQRSTEPEEPPAADERSRGARALWLLLAGRAQDRRQARHRPLPGRGDRDRGPGAKARRARLHRSRWRA